MISSWLSLVSWSSIRNSCKTSASNDLLKSNSWFVNCRSTNKLFYNISCINELFRRSINKLLQYPMKMCYKNIVQFVLCFWLFRLSCLLIIAKYCIFVIFHISPPFEDEKIYSKVEEEKEDKEEQIENINKKKFNWLLAYDIISLNHVLFLIFWAKKYFVKCYSDWP